MKLDRLLFRAWLAGQDPARTFAQLDTCKCPLACFAREAMKLPDPRVRRMCWNDDEAQHPSVRMPHEPWAAAFVKRVDHFIPANETGTGLSITAADTLAVLDSIQETP